MLKRGFWSELIDIPVVLLCRLGYDGLFAASAIFFKLLRAWENSDALKNPDRNCINCERHDCSNCYRRVALQVAARKPARVIYPSTPPPAI